jgi:nucleoside-diphosphate-sugar epimerase
MKYLITGGAGFIGTNLCLQLQKLKPDCKITVVDNNPESCHKLASIAPNVKIFINDFSDAYILSLIEKGEYDGVFHLAAVPRVAYSVEHPIYTHEENLTKTLHLGKACSRGKKTPLIFASSSSIYGDIDEYPTPEDADKKPKSPYALQKYCCELYLKQFHEFYGLPCAFMRFFNVFGPYQVATNAYATVVCAWATALSKGEKIRFDGDGTQSRDFCFVEDVCSALILAMDTPSVHNAETFNVAQGDTTSLNTVFDLFKSKYSIEENNIVRAPFRAGDVKKTHAKVSKAKELLGFIPKWPFEKGLEKTFAWWDSIK